MRLKADISALDLALARIHVLTDSTERGRLCALPAEVKEAVRNYVDSWIEPLIAAVLMDMRGEKRLPNYMGLEKTTADRSYFPPMDRSQKLGI